MKKFFPSFLAVLALAAASLACALPGLPGAAGGDGALLRDDFEGLLQNWGTGTDATSAVEYQNGGLRFQVFETNHFVWSSPNQEQYQNVRIEVTVRNQSSDPLATFGILCHQGSVTDNMYYFAVSPSGDYAIVRAAAGEEDLFLTNDNQWASSSLIPKSADSYRIAAECGSGTLTLFVNGQQVDSVQDSAYTSGTVGLFAWNDQQPNGTDVTFDDFVITSLP